MEDRTSSGEYPNEYIDIVNEINDFIASLDAPPLDDHTSQLVGNPPSQVRKNTFGYHSNDDDAAPSWEGLARSRHRSAEDSGPPAVEGTRSRHRSGEDRIPSAEYHAQTEVTPLSPLMKGAGLDADVVTIQASAMTDLGVPDAYGEVDKTGPFPVNVGQFVDPDLSTYDYVGAPGSSSSTQSATDTGDYSDCSNSSFSLYSDASSSCSGDAADSDSGCYSQGRQLRSPVTGHDGLSSSSSSNVPHYQSPTALASLSKQPHPEVARGKQPSNASSPAHFYSSPRSQDESLHLGSSAHTLASGRVAPVGIPIHLPASKHPLPTSPSVYRKTAKGPGILKTPPPPSSPNHQFGDLAPSSPSFPGVAGEGAPQSPVRTLPHPHTSSPSPSSPSPIRSPKSPSPQHFFPAASSPSSPPPPRPSSPRQQTTTPQKLTIKQRWPPEEDKSTCQQLHQPQHSPHHHQHHVGAPHQSHPLSKSPAPADAKFNHYHHPPSHKHYQHQQQQHQQVLQQQQQRQQRHRDQGSPQPAVVASSNKEKPAVTQGSHPCAKGVRSLPDDRRAQAGDSPTPISRVPDLSVLISELQSVSPTSELSPNLAYKTCARSESASPAPGPGASGTPSYPCSASGSEPQTPAPPFAPRIVPGSTRLSESPEHDYEPIENIQLEVPTSPRPETKFPHPKGIRTMADGGSQPKHVKALHNFKGSNNDELCFKKGDIITVTQWIEGGWWEGTLNGRTGWFPSNYVKEVKADISLKGNKSGDVPVYKRESMQLYHNVVLKNVIETEKTHVSEMIKVLQSYIKPIEGANLLSASEYSLLIGNLDEIITFQQSFLNTLEECEKLPSSQRRIGGIFMHHAPAIKELYSLYCANHPKAVSVLQKRREELSKFVESQGAPPPGAQTLITILSKPFTRLDKYPSLLKELERHVEESHPDRGDTQRAIAVYRNIANSCLEIRKLKEMEHEIVTSTIQGWEGEEISKLGEILHLSQVKLHTQTGEKFERIFVLFQSCLVMLSMSTRLSSYQYEGKIPLSGLAASSFDSESVQNGFEISGPMIEKITVSCGTKSEVTSWLDVLHQLVSSSGHPQSSAKPQPLQVHMISTCQPSVSTVTPAKTAQITSTMPPAPPPQGPLTSKTSCVWSLTCLRPSPPQRPSLMCRDEVLKSPKTARKSTQKRKPVRTFSGEETDWHSKNDPKVYNEDAFILQVIEAYCNSVKTRHTVNSSILNSPQILLAEDEKIFDENEQQERTVVDTVYALQDRVKELEQEQRKLRTELEEEKRCRRKLETLVKGQFIKSGIIDGVRDGET